MVFLLAMVGEENLQEFANFCAKQIIHSRAASTKMIFMYVEQRVNGCQEIKYKNVFQTVRTNTELSFLALFLDSIKSQNNLSESKEQQRLLSYKGSFEAVNLIVFKEVCHLILYFYLPTRLT